jgi:hypothetical protein
MLYVPPESLAPIEIAGERVAAEFDISPGWLNSKVQIRADSLPTDWRRRRIWVGTWGRLWVYAVSRPDLIAMKVLAGRPQDVVDLESVRVRVDEAEFVRTFLEKLPEQGTPQDQIEDARRLLNGMRLFDHD